MITKFAINDEITGTFYNTAVDGSISDVRAFELMTEGAGLGEDFAIQLLALSEVHIAQRSTGLILDIEKDS